MMSWYSWPKLVRKCSCEGKTKPLAGWWVPYKQDGSLEF
uniref:Uncharacterized protein n=1 Tax=Medicago truncatula TaxID=3880 RepID=I3T3V5_MEDTR|nr:unknown [Medicago truncatula]